MGMNPSDLCHRDSKYQRWTKQSRQSSDYRIFVTLISKSVLQSMHTMLRYVNNMMDLWPKFVLTRYIV